MRDIWRKSMANQKINNLKSVIASMIYVARRIIEFQQENDNDPSHKNTYMKLLRHCKSAERLVWNCQHIEILASLYNSFVSGKEQYYIILTESIYKNVKKWDTTKKGFEEFMALDQEARDKFNEEKEERIKQQEMIKKAREEGKKIDFVFENGKLIPVVLEENKN